jgi:hypothetical protein
MQVQQKNIIKLSWLMGFLLVTLGSLSSFQAEIMVYESKFCHDRAIPAGTSGVFRNTEHAFSGNAVEQLMMFLCTAVIGRTCRAEAC